MAVRGTAGMLAMAIVVVAALVAAPAAGAATSYWVVGKGWGHGIGMSQYGARGFAENGRTHVQIIKHYYQGTTVVANGVPGPARRLNVLLKQGASAAAFEVDKSGVVIRRGSSSWDTEIGDIVTAKIESGKTSVYRKRGSTTRRLLSGTSSTVVLSGRDGSLQTRFRADNGFYGHHYRGTIALRLSNSRLMVINRVGMEKYLRSVVPDEMPPSWHQQALRAQAIAARSYAIATKKKSGAFDAFADTRSQMYGGIEHETAATNSAVSATAGKVARYAGVAIPAFFHSTSGGRTASIEHVWNSDPRPYLTSVSDPYERSPHSRWHARYSPAAFERTWGGVPGTLRGVSFSLNGSRRVRNVTAIGSRGSRTLTGADFRMRFGLKSSFLRIEKVVLNASSYRVRRGSRVRLSGTAPRAGVTRLVYRNSGSRTWVDAGRLYPDSNRRFVRRVEVKAKRVYAVKRARRLGPAIVIRVY